MENASKALIIAGSVLIAILVISLGLLIFKSTSGTTAQTQDLGKTLEVQQFNSQFLKYCGDSVKGSQVETLCGVIIAHNANSEDSKKVKIFGTDDVNMISKKSNSIKTNQNYKVTQNIDKSTGLIEYIEVQEVQQ